ncbi:unnamed protein product, partial [Prorocentrum cordatum]
ALERPAPPRWPPLAQGGRHVPPAAARGRVALGKRGAELRAGSARRWPSVRSMGPDSQDVLAAEADMDRLRRARAAQQALAPQAPTVPQPVATHAPAAHVEA